MGGIPLQYRLCILTGAEDLQFLHLVWPARIRPQDRSGKAQYFWRLNICKCGSALANDLK